MDREKKSQQEKRSNKKNKPERPLWRKILKGVGIALSILILLTLIAFSGLNIYVKHKTGSSILEDYRKAEKIVEKSSKATFRTNASSRFLDINGNEIKGTTADDSSKYLRYEQIPKNVVNAFVSIEDPSYWKNKGYSISGMARALLGYAHILNTKSGGSSITQQVAKNTFLTQEVSLDRKVNEICLAIWMNRKYSKQDIMEFYVNQCFFSNGSYGIENASQLYFGVSADKLSLSQTAYLCAIPNRPSYYNPYREPTNAIGRRDRILLNMYREGYISKAKYQVAIAENLTIQSSSLAVDNYQITYAQECAIRFFEKYYKEDSDAAAKRVASGGYTIQTSLNPWAQKKIQNSVDTNLAAYSEKDDTTGLYKLQGAVTAIDNKTGKVVAVIGGRTQIATENAYTLNRAYRSYRQPGSSIKPLIVYTPAFMKGYKPESYRHAVASSNNDTATQVFSEITPSYGISFLKEMDFDRIVAQDENLPSALGGLTHGVTVEQMTGAYRALSNDGLWSQPTCVVSITDIDGKEIYQGSKYADKKGVSTETKQVYDKDAANSMVDVMKSVISSGTASSMDWSTASNETAYGKTGTTNDNKDGWFCGSTSQYTISVWVGCDHPEEIADLHGNTYPLSIWKECMLALLNQKE